MGKWVSAVDFQSKMRKKLTLVNLNIALDEMAISLMKRYGQLQRIKRIEPEKEEEIENRKENGLVEVDEDTYKGLLEYYQAIDPSWRDYRDVPHPEGAKVVSVYVKDVATGRGLGGVLITKKRPNNLIEYQVGGRKEWGIVFHLFDVPLDNDRDQLVLIRVLETVEAPELRSLLHQIGILQLSTSWKHILVPCSAVVATCAYCELPPRALGFQKSLLLVNVKRMVEE